MTVDTLEARILAGLDDEHDRPEPGREQDHRPDDDHEEPRKRAEVLADLLLLQHEGEERTERPQRVLPAPVEKVEKVGTVGTVGTVELVSMMTVVDRRADSTAPTERERSGRARRRPGKTPSSFDSPPLSRRAAKLRRFVRDSRRGRPRQA